MKNLAALVSGVAGACALNLIHESGRKLIPNAPHIDQVVIRAIGKSLRWIGVHPPSLGSLRRIAMAGDVLSNSLYYAAIGGLSVSQSKRDIWMRAWILGTAAGVIVVQLPPVLGLGQQPSRKFSVTAALTVGWYLTGALVTAAVYEKWQQKPGLAQAAVKQNSGNIGSTEANQLFSQM
jgi:hypothetical protein